MDPDETIFNCEDKMDKAVQHAIHEFSGLHTGKASPSMVEGIQVAVAAYGGASMAIREMAAVSTPDHKTIQITPWDKSVMRDIEKAIQTANIGLNPLVDATLIRIPIPELTGERRRELVKVAHNKAEEGRVGVRKARHDALNALKKAQKDSEISEDDYHLYEKEVQDMTDKHVEKINKLLEEKDADLTTV